MTGSVIQGTEIGRTECPSCGQSLSIKINKAGCAYFYCAAIVGDHNGKPERCFTRLNMGRVGSAKLIQTYLEGRKNNESYAQTIVPEPTTAPAGIPAGADNQRAGITSWFD